MMIPVLFAAGALEQALMLVLAALVLVLVLMMGMFLKLFSRYLDLLSQEKVQPPAVAPVAPSAAVVQGQAVEVAAPPVVSVAPVVSPAPAAVVAASMEVTDPELVAVLAAAAAATLGQDYRIVSMQPAMPAAQIAWPVMNPWAIEGRVQIFSGRRVR